MDESLQRTHTFVLELERRLGSLEHQLSLIADNVQSAKQNERRVTNLELALRATAEEQRSGYERLFSSIEVVRGLATGARGGRPSNQERQAERQALEIGQRVLGMVSTPEGRAQLILELQAQGGGDPVGGVPFNPRVNGGSPV